MADSNGALTEAQEKLHELLEAAKSGAIIPIRLPGQVEEIATLLVQAEDEQREQAKAAASAAIPADLEAYIEDEAEFVRHAVHELRTPMTSIRGYVDMIGSMGELSDMQKQFIDVVKNNARRMEKLLADVSFINKLRTNTLRLEPKMDTFKNIAMRVEKDFAPVAEDLNRQLEFDIPQGLPLLNLDGDVLATALNKLVENALQYSPEGTGKVTLRGDADGNLLVIKVEDNGIGMSDDELAQLGTIYFRGDRDEVREYKGSGLGIPIAFGMIERLEGEIEVDSTVDAGTIFTIRLPGMT